MQFTIRHFNNWLSKYWWSDIAMLGKSLSFEVGQFEQNSCNNRSRSSFYCWWPFRCIVEKTDIKRTEFNHRYFNAEDIPKMRTISRTWCQVRISTLCWGLYDGDFFRCWFLMVMLKIGHQQNVINRPEHPSRILV